MDILLGFWKEELFSSKVAERQELPPWMDEPTLATNDWDRELTKEITLEANINKSKSNHTQHQGKIIFQLV